MRIEESDTPLHIAARLGHTETLAMILRHLKPRGDHTPLHWHNCPRKVDLTACNAQGKTALDVAQNPIIRAMLDSYVTCQSIQDLVKNHGTEEIDRTTLEILFQKLNSLLDLLNAPIKATDLAGNAYYTNGLNYQVDLRDEQGWSPVHWAVSKQSIPMIQALQDLCDKYSFAAVNSEGYSPLHLAARQLPNNERSYTTTWNLIRRMSPSELHARTPSILGAANARPDVDDGSTAMHIAVNASNTHVLKAMAESDAIIETTEDTSGFTTLQHAVMYGKKDAVATWLEHRNLNLSINAPDTIILMQLAATSGKNLPSQLADDIGSLEDYASIIDLLIQYGAKPYYTHRDNNLTNTSISGVSLGTSPLYLAVKHKNRPAVIALLKHGAKGHETYGLLWKEFPLSMCSAHVIKIVFTLILLPFYFIGFHTPFKKSSYCKLALGTHRMSAFFDGSVFRKSTKPFAKTDTPPQRTATDQFNSGEVSQGKPTACEQEAIEMTSLMVHRGESGDGERPTDEATTTDGNTIFTQYHIHPIAS